MNPASPLDNVRIVLSHTSHPGNIGATARAMKTMGLSKLYLVNPKSFPDSEADARASNARDILAAAHVYDNLAAALNNTVLATALTARHRDLPHPTCNARQAAAELMRYAQHHPVALVFGRESAGLTAAEISHCQLTVRIPANPDYSSLNLAAAVQVIAYELRMVLEEAAVIQPPVIASLPDAASLQEIEGLHHHLEQVMIHSGFLDPAHPKHLMRRMRRLFARTRLEKEEVNILRGLLTAVDPQRFKH